MAQKKTVSFWAQKRVTVPVKVKFKTKEGKEVSFVAKRHTTKPIKVKFKAKK